MDERETSRTLTDADGVNPDSASPDPLRVTEGAQKAVQATDRDTRGRFAPGNRAARRHGLKLFERRGELPDGLRDELDAFRAGLISDQGGDAELAIVRRGYVDRLVATEAAIRLLEADLATRGLLTPRGRMRSTYTAWLSALDRWDKLAQRLGLDRRAARVPSLATYLEERTP